jgi:hypothetical protein
MTQRWKYRLPILWYNIRHPLKSLIAEGNYMTFCFWLEHGDKAHPMNLSWYKEAPEEASHV